MKKHITLNALSKHALLTISHARMTACLLVLVAHHVAHGSSSSPSAEPIRFTSSMKPPALACSEQQFGARDVAMAKPVEQEL